MKKYLAEFLGSYFYLVVFMTSATFATLSKNIITMSLTPVILALSYLVFSQLMSKTSGGHLTPLVSIPMAFAKKISFESLAYYLIMQILGALAAVMTTIAMTKQLFADMKLTGDATQAAATMDIDNSSIMGFIHHTLMTSNQYLTTTQITLTLLVLLIATVAITVTATASATHRILATAGAFAATGFLVLGSSASLDLLNPAQMLISYLMTDMRHPLEVYGYILGSCLFIAAVAFIVTWFTNDRKQPVAKY